MATAEPVAGGAARHALDAGGIRSDAGGRPLSGCGTGRCPRSAPGGRCGRRRATGRWLGASASPDRPNWCATAAPPTSWKSWTWRPAKRRRCIRASADPAWSPAAGGPIAFVTGTKLDNPVREELWLIEADGTNPRKLADGGFPSWSRDGKHLFYRHGLPLQIRSLEIGKPGAEPVLYLLPAEASFYPAVSPRHAGRLWTRQTANRALAIGHAGSGWRRSAELERRPAQLVARQPLRELWQLRLGRQSRGLDVRCDDQPGADARGRLADAAALVARCSKSPSMSGPSPKSSCSTSRR